MTRKNISLNPSSIITSEALATVINLFDIKDDWVAKVVFDKVISGICKGNNIKMSNELMRNRDRSFRSMRVSRPVDEQEKRGIVSAIVFKILGTDKITQLRSKNQESWVKLITDSNRYLNQVQNNDGCHAR